MPTDDQQPYQAPEQPETFSITFLVTLTALSRDKIPYTGVMTAAVREGLEAMDYTDGVNIAISTSRFPVI